ncbi:hypothetical protein G9A89_009021 [Geosiphon pyriformis]|nr:hypothetical protein G9A89_009021 [Geosiphon pyriformis]
MSQKLDWPTESAFNCYINKRIVYYLGGQEDPEPTFNNFFSELLQSTTLPQNYLFAPLITEINREIEKYTKQKFPITFVDKDKRRLQTPAGTPKQIQLLTWKKQRFDLPANPSYYHIPGSIINIINTATISMTMPLNKIPFQNFGAISPWEITDSEEEESSDQKINKQNLILENLEIKTPVNQTSKNQNNQNSNVINQHLPPVIVINLPPALPNAEQQQQPQLLPQQIQQQSQQQPMAYALIAKIKKFTTNRWNDDRALQSLAVKSQTFQEFKTAFLGYFNNNNSINRLANTFTTIKQGENEAVTTYLECFHRNLCQIQAIQTDYFIHPPMHTSNASSRPSSYTNHAQAVNLVMNGSFELDSKLKQFKNNSCFQNQLCPSSSPNQPWQQEMRVCHNCVPNSELSIQLSTISTDLPANNATANISTTCISTSNLLTTATDNISITTATNNLSDTHSSNTIKSHPKLEIGDSCLPTNLQFIQPAIRITTAEFRNWVYSKPKFPELFKSSKPKQKQSLINILPATVMKDESLVAIFPFKIEKLTETSLFSGAALEEKLIMAMYTDAKINSQFIKLILDSGSAGSIITKQLMNQLADGATKTFIDKINDFLIKINGITVPIKVLVIENMQELQFSQNGQHTQVPATCDHFKILNMPAPLIEFEEEKKKPTWKAYQISWADENHNELLPILFWDNNGKGKQKKIKLT